MSSPFFTIPFEVAVQGKYFISYLSCRNLHVMTVPDPRGEVVVELWKASPPPPSPSN